MEDAISDLIIGNIPAALPPLVYKEPRHEVGTPFSEDGTPADKVATSTGRNTLSAEEYTIPVKKKNWLKMLSLLVKLILL